METCSLQSLAVTSIPTPLLIEKPFFHGQVLNFPISNKYPVARNLHFRVQSPSSSASKIISQAATGNTEKQADAKDQNLAFVAGATGKVGSRTVRELLKLGFRVRAGVRSAQRAQTLVQSVKQMKIDETQSVEKLELVECDLEKPDQIVPALGNASLVICCIGASEKEIFDITGPYRIDYQATKNLIDAATVAKVSHFIMVSSLGTNKFGFPAAILNLFWGVLLWKRKAEEALIASCVPYTIVRPGGMERPTDAFKETHNITLLPEDTLFGGLVSNLQVAELIAVIAKNPRLSYFKVVEAIAETTAPLTPMEELLRKIPSARPDYFPNEPVAPSLDPTPPESVISKEPATSVPDPTPSETVISKDPTTPTVSRPLSPYAAYDDLKPPSSPCPSSPILDGSSLSGNSTPTILDEPSAKQELDGSITRPLSPFAMYEDLKPPSSPCPSTP